MKAFNSFDFDKANKYLSAGDVSSYMNYINDYWKELNLTRYDAKYNPNYNEIINLLKLLKFDEAIEMINKYKSDMNETNKNDIFHAIRTKNIPLIIKILNNDISQIEIPIKAYGTPLLYACLATDCDLEIIKLLLEYGANINVKDDNGWNIVKYLFVYKKNKLEFFNLLLPYKPDMSTYFRYATHAITEFEIYELCVKHKLIDINNKIKGEWVIKYLIFENDYKKIKKLLELGFNPNAHIDNASLLQYCSFHHHNGILNLLLKYHPEIRFDDLLYSVISFNFYAFGTMIRKKLKKS